MILSQSEFAWAFVLIALTLAVALVIGRKRRQGTGKPKTEVSADVTSTAEGDPPVLIVFASQSGFAESIAWQTAERVQKSGNPVSLRALGTVDPDQIASAQHALFIVSTTGKGEPPDNARIFVRNVIRRKANLHGLHYDLLALGDRNYDNYCAFGHRLDRWLRQSGATPAANLIEVDNGEIAALRRWQDSLESAGLARELPDWTPRRYFRWKLAERRLLNPGSPGGAIYFVALTPLDPPPVWQAGDIAEVFPGPAGRVFSERSVMACREYTAASLPADGRLELLVRQVTHCDGTAGIGSDWLTRKAAPGERIALRIRTNRTFHAPPDDRPMILIGNGTGAAGLRAHLKARAALNRSRNWLVFGERTAAHDWLFRDQIEEWQAAGHIARVDVAFSRDQTEKVYVQHRLMEAADEIRAWIDIGAAIYVCGSLEGMAGGVTDALTSILGEAHLDQLIAAGRYRRDVY